MKGYKLKGGRLVPHQIRQAASAHSQGRCLCINETTAPILTHPARLGQSKA
jgi:hypothetical protein